MSADKRQLYRQSFFDAQKTHTEGVIMIPASLHLTSFAIASVLILSVFIAFITYGSYTRKARLDGLAMPSSGLVKVMAQQGGRVESLLVIEGQAVQAGAPLYRVSGERYDGQGNASVAALTQSIQMQQSMLANQRMQALAMNGTQQAGLLSRETQLSAELESAKSVLRLSERQATLIRSALEPYERLAKQGYVSAMDSQQKQIELANSEARVEEQRQAQQRLQRDLSATRSERQRIGLEGKTRISELDRQLQGISQQQIELSARGESMLTAPVAGTIAAIMVKPGQAANANDAMLAIVPSNSRMQVELYAPSKSVGFIKPGQKVGLRFAAYPYEKFGVQYGITREISKVALTPNDVAVRSPFAWKENEAHYRVIVELLKPTVTAYGREEPLKVGMAVSADVDLDTRKIYEWALEPLWSLRGKI
jgi:membrane fusion protein